MPSASPSAPSSRWLAPALLALYCAGATLLWVLAALALQRQCGWMAIPVAIGGALVLRWSGGVAGPGSALLAAAAVVAVSAAANWCIAAAHIGAPLGLPPWESALKLGPAYAWTLTGLATTRADLLCQAIAPVLAGWSGIALNGRRRPPSTR